MAGTNIYGELIRAQAENAAADPSAALIGRIFYNTVEGRFKGDSGSAIRSFLRNDDKCVIGTNGTANTNVRFHRAGVGLFQVVLGGDATAEGSVSTNQATFSNQKMAGVVITDYADFTEIAAPSSPAATTLRLYSKTDDKFYYKNSAGTETELLTTATTGAYQPTRNFLFNSNFDLWQRGTTGTVANTVSTYMADRWYTKNSLGTNGVITQSQQTGASDGALYACKLLITTAPTAAQANGCELYQTLDRDTSLMLYNQTASFSIKVKAFGNVNQCGIQFYYKTTEAKVDTGIGAEVTATVNTGSFTTITIAGQALGTSQTTAGVIGVRIRITAVSSGNTYDLNNGFSVEQGIINVGSAIATYQRMHADMPTEVAACQRFYEKSYNLTTNPGTAATTVGNRKWVAPVTANTELTTVTYLVRKRTTPTVTYYSTVTGTSGQSRDLTAGADLATTSSNVGETEAGVTLSATDQRPYAFHWVADAEI